MSHGNREYWKKALDNLSVIRAFVDGKDIEMFDPVSGTWYDPGRRTRHDFAEPTTNYRIKPEPREVWVVTHQYRMPPLAFTSKIEADKYKILANVPGRSVRYVAVDDV